MMQYVSLAKARPSPLYAQAMTTQTLRKLIIRACFLLDQVAFSVANFLLTVLLARHYSADEMSAYTVALSISFMLLNIQSSCYVVQNAVVQPAIMRNRARRIFGLHIIFTIFLLSPEILILLGMKAAGASAYDRATVYATIILTLLYSQLGFDRMMMVKHERYLTPLVTAGSFLILITFMLFAAPRWHWSYVLTMGIVGVYSLFRMGWLACVIGLPDLRTGWGLTIRALRRYLAGALAGFAGSAGFIHVPILVLGAVSPKVQSAAFGAMRGLTQPLQILVRSLDIVDKNFFHHKPVMTLADMRDRLVRQIAVYAVLSGGILLGLWAFGPLVVHLAYKGRYDAYEHLLVGSTAISAMLALSFPLETGVVKMKRINRYNAYRMLAGLTGAALAFALCRPYGAAGAITASLGGWLASLLCACWTIRDLLLTTRAQDVPLAADADGTAKDYI